jgi:hypothetical protein
LKPVKFTPGSRDVEREVAVLDGLIVTEERPHIASLVDELQRASQPADFYRLQRKLLRRSYARQVVSDELRGEIQQTKQRLKELTATRPLPGNEVRALQAVLANQELAERSCKAVTHALRCVGDGIAWKALRYDRGAISVLGSGQRVRRLASGRGLDAELEAMAEHWWNGGSFAIHNDLTNCLRTGDLTLPFEPGNTVAIREVKAGSAQRGAQIKAAEERIAFLRDGRSLSGLGKGPAHIARYPVRFRTELHVLRRLLAEARRDGYASAQVSPGVVVTTVDPRVSGGRPGIDVVAERARARAGWYDDPRIVMTLTIVRRVRERMHHFPYLAPLTIYPLPPDDIAELLLGPLEYVTILHAPTLEREFAVHGVEAQVITRKPEADSVFLRAARGSAQVELPSLVCEQMLTELMHPSCLVETVSHMLDTIDAGSPLGATLVCMAGEQDAWARGSQC